MERKAYNKIGRRTFLLGTAAIVTEVGATYVANKTKPIELVTYDATTPEVAKLPPFPHGITEKILKGDKTKTPPEADTAPHADFFNQKFNPNLRKLLTNMANAGIELQLSCIHTGHDPIVAGRPGVVSDHTRWDAVDITMVDGHNVGALFKAPLTKLALDMKAGVYGPVPTQMGLPFDVDGPKSHYFFQDGPSHFHIAMARSGKQTVTGPIKQAK